MKKRGDRIDVFKKNMRRVFWLFFLLFLILAAYFIKLIYADAGAIAVNPYNTRVKMDDPAVKCGAILDMNGQTLAESTKTDGGYFRGYPYGKVLSHVIGYAALGKSGIESKFHFELQKPRFDLWQRIQNLTAGTEIKANNTVLTVDADFSKYIREQLGERKGSVVVLEPSTGKILSMISYPNFNPETVAADWAALSASEESPLLNRAAQGQYIPGSIFKTITAAAAIETLPDWAGFTYECKGEATFGESKLVCFDAKAHGTVDFTKAFAESCNLYYAELGLKIKAETMRQTASSFYIDQPYDFQLDYTAGSFTLGDGATVSEVIETAIGQGKTLVTPLNMAMMAGAAANGGLMMRPYIVDRLTSDDGAVTVKKYLPEALGQTMLPETADVIKDMMVACVAEGRGAPAGLPDIQVAGKTGTAENPAGEDHAWFIGFAPAEEPAVAFAVLLENAGGGGKALALTKSMLEYYFGQ